MTQTNDTTRRILEFLFSQGAFCWRQNVLPIPVLRAGAVAGFRSGGKSGIPDIIGVLPALWGNMGGRFIGIEIKTGRDTLRPEQIGFHTTARKLGAVILVVKDFPDFLEQWEKLSPDTPAGLPE